MRLEEYIDRVGRVITRHITDTEGCDAAAEGRGDKRVSMKAEFDRAFSEVKAAIANNKALLGVFDGNGGQAGTPEVMKKREIDPVNLRRHILKVRHDLSRHGQNIDASANSVMQGETVETIIVRVLDNLTAALGIHDLGGVFSATESVIYEKEFGHEERRESQPPEFD